MKQYVRLRNVQGAEHELIVVLIELRRIGVLTVGSRPDTVRGVIVFSRGSMNHLHNHTCFVSLDNPGDLRGQTDINSSGK